MLTSLLLAFRSIARNRLRAALTILGIVIGVASLIVVTTLASGVSARISGSMQGFSASAITISPEAAITGQKMIVRPLTERDVKQITRELRAVEMAAPSMSSATTAINGGTQESSTAVGTTREFFTIKHTAFTQGGPWLAEEESQKMKVCVLGAEISKWLFGEDADPVGRTIRIGDARTPFRVVGVLRTRGTGAGKAGDNVVIMPIGTFRAKIHTSGDDRIDSIDVLAAAESTKLAERQIVNLLRQRHRIPEGEQSDFKIGTAHELQKLQIIIAAAVSALLSCIASVSLIVGGIGVMNIMLVSVTARTREIGIRISVGATSADIMLQFLAESVVLTSLGGLLGLGLGFLGSKAASGVAGFDLSPSAPLALGAVAVSAALGILFGYLPARRAAHLDPVEALR